MRRAVALLAASLAVAGLAAGCGGGGAEPGAPIGATLVLDFTPNAVHSGIFAARAEGFYEDAGVDLQVRAPGESTDGAVFFVNDGKPLGPGHLVVRTNTDVFDFNTE